MHALPTVQRGSTGFSSNLKAYQPPIPSEGKGSSEKAGKGVVENQPRYRRLRKTAGGATTTVFGPSEGHDSAIVNAGVGPQITSRAAAYVEYQGQLGRDRYDANGVMGGNKPWLLKSRRRID